MEGKFATRSGKVQLCPRTPKSRNFQNVKLKLLVNVRGKKELIPSNTMHFPFSESISFLFLFPKVNWGMHYHLPYMLKKIASYNSDGQVCMEADTLAPGLYFGLYRPNQAFEIWPRSQLKAKGDL